MIEQKISYGHVFFQNFLPGGIAALRNGTFVLIVGSSNNKARELRIPQTLLCDVAMELFARWQDDGGKVDAAFHEFVVSRDVAVRTPDVLYMSPYPPRLQCPSGRCGLVDPPVKGHRKTLVRMFAARVRGSKPNIPCSACGTPLRQFPFVQIHKCGHLAPLEMPRAARYVRARFHDKGTFRRSSWTAFDSGENLGSAFQGLCAPCSYGNDTDSNETQRVAMAATRLRGGRGETFYPQLVQFIAFSPETTRILTAFRADRSVAADLGRAIVCGLLDLQDGHQLRTNLDDAVNLFLASVKTDRLAIEKGKLKDSIEVLRGRGMLDSAARLEEELRLMNESPSRASGLFGDSDRFVSDESVLSQLGSHQRAAEAAFIRDEFTEVSQLSELTDTNPAKELLALDRQSNLRELYGVREVRYIQDIETVIAAIGFSRQVAWPNGKQNGDAPKLNAFVDELDPTLIGKAPIYAAPIRTEAILLRLDPCRVLRWAIETLAWPRPQHAYVLSDTRRAHAAILRMAPALATTPMEIRRLAPQHPDSPSSRSAVHLLGLLHTLVHCALRTARSGSGYDMTSLSEYLFPADLSALILVGSRKSFTMGGLQTLFKYKLRAWFDQAARESLRCILDPQCSQQRGASCNACLQLPLGCETFNHGISRAYLVGGDVPDVNGETLRVEHGFWA